MPIEKYGPLETRGRASIRAARQAAAIVRRAAPMKLKATNTPHATLERMSDSARHTYRIRLAYGSAKHWNFALAQSTFKDDETPARPTAVLEVNWRSAAAPIVPSRRS